MKTVKNYQCDQSGETTGMNEADSKKDSSAKCTHPKDKRVFVACEGDAESGPITITACKDCGDILYHFGM